MKDKLRNVQLRGIEKAGLFEVKGVNKVDTQIDRHEAASSYSAVVSLFASLRESINLGSRESVELESSTLNFQSCVKSESIPKNVKQLDILHRRIGHPNEQTLMKVLSNCNEFRGINKIISLSFCQLVCMEKAINNITQQLLTKPVHLLNLYTLTYGDQPLKSPIMAANTT